MPFLRKWSCTAVSAVDAVKAVSRICTQPDNMIGCWVCEAIKWHMFHLICWKALDVFNGC